MTKIKFGIIIFVLIIITIIDFNIGHIKIPFTEILKFFSFSTCSNEWIFIIKEFRFPRVFSALFAGAALSVSGLLMQTIFRNPLAGPYVLGISSGASLGVAITVLGTSFIGIQIAAVSNYISVIAAAIGSALVLAIILSISLRIKDNLSILIIGILIAGVVSSIVSILQYFGNETNVKSYLIWTMGSLNAVSFNDVIFLFPAIIITLIAVFINSKSLNLLLLGENFAKTMGVNILRNRILVFTFVSILTGVVTSYCGPLGFVGIVVPHIARWLFNTSNHFILIPASVIIGAGFLICGDICCNLISSQGILPINAIISILGVPFIIWIVLKNKRTII